jgi:hypothetical protein
MSKSSEYKVYQRQFPIYDGRYDVSNPVETSAPPIQLFEPAFSYFLDDVASNARPDNEVAKAAVSYMRAASGIYATEDDRKKAIAPSFRCILGMGVSTVINSDRTTPDGLIEVSESGEIPESAAFLLEEQKRDSDQGDASVQCGLSMARYWAQPEVQSRALILVYMEFDL